MKKLIRLIDQDVVASLNNLRRAGDVPNSSNRFVALMLSIHAPRMTWVKLIGPLILAAIPMAFLPNPAKIYWAFACIAMNLVFFSLYFYRLALIRQRWLDKHQVDEFGACNASADDLYEMPSD